MLNLVSPSQQIPEHGTSAALAKDYADAQRQLSLLHQQQHAGLVHLLAIIQFRRDDANRIALAPDGTEHERGQAFAMQSLVKEVHAVLGLTEN